MLIALSLKTIDRHQMHSAADSAFLHREGEESSNCCSQACRNQDGSQLADNLVIAVVVDATAATTTFLSFARTTVYS